MCRRMEAGAWLGRFGIVQSELTANGIFLFWSLKMAKTVVSAGAVKSRVDQSGNFEVVSNDGAFYFSDSSFCHSDEMKLVTYMDFISGITTNRIELGRIGQ